MSADEAGCELISVSKNLQLYLNVGQINLYNESLQVSLLDFVSWENKKNRE